MTSREEAPRPAREEAGSPPAAGEGGRRRVKVRPGRRLWKNRRFLIGFTAAVLLVLLAVNLFLVVALSPRRKKYRYYQGGFAAYQRGDLATAEILFRRYLKYEPDRAEARYMLGMILLRRGKTAEAVAALEEVVRRRPNFDYALIALSDVYRRRKDYRRARDYAERAAAVDPVPVDAWIALGEARLALGDQEGAIRAFRRAVARDPDLIEVRLKLGDLYYVRQKLGLLSGELAESQYADARDAARKRLLDRPGDVQARIWLAKAQAGLGDLDEAVAELERIVEERPGEASYRLLLAGFEGQLKAFDRQVEILEKAWKETPAPGVAVRLAEAVERGLSDGVRAEEVLRGAIRRFPDDPGLRVALAGVLRRREDFEGAEKVMAEAAARFPGSASVLEARGDLALARGEEDAALAAWRELLRTHPENLSGRRKLLARLVPRLLALIDRGEDPGPLRGEVLGHLAVFLDPKTGLNPSDLRARAWRARVAFAEGDFRLARDLLGGTGGARPGTVDGLRILGLACLESGDYERAARALTDALEHPDGRKTPEDYSLAYGAAYRAGWHAREVEIAGEAARRWPEDPEWQLRLASSCFRARRPDRALEACDRAKTLLAAKKDVRAHLLAARIHQARGERAEARRELESAVLLRRDAETRGALYSFFLATGDDVLAERGFRALVEENPDDEQALLRFGDFLLRRSNEPGLDRKALTRDALAQYEKALRLHPDSPEALYRVAELRIAEASTEEERIEEAERIVGRIARRDPGNRYLLYFTGKLRILKGEYPEAVAALRRYKRENPDDPAGLYYLGIALRRAGNLEEARNEFLGALGLDPGMVEAQLELATLYFGEGIRARFAGDMVAARKAFGEASRLDPEEPETNRFLAEALTSLGLLDQAEEHAERVLEKKRDDPGALFLSGLIRARRGDLEGATSRFARLVEVAPENFRSHLYLGMALAERRRFEAARARLAEAYRLAPDSHEVLRALVLVDVSAGKETEALALVEAERERRPDDGFIHHLLGGLYRRAGRAGDALAEYRRAFELSPRDGVALALAAALLADGGREEEARRLLAEGAERCPAPAGLHTLRARMLRAAGREREAEAALLKALEADPEYGSAHRDLGLLLLDAGRGKEGERHLRKAAELGVRDPAVFFRLARRAAARGEREAAEKDYRRVLELLPEHVPTLNNLALLVAEEGERADEALALAGKARRVRPRDPKVSDTWGWVLFLAGRREEAAGVLLEAARVLDDDPVVLYHAGLAAHRVFRWEDARRLLQRAFDLAPDHPLAAEARKALDDIR